MHENRFGACGRAGNKIPTIFNKIRSHHRI